MNVFDTQIPKTSNRNHKELFNPVINDRGPKVDKGSGSSSSKPEQSLFKKNSGTLYCVEPSLSQFTKGS